MPLLLLWASQLVSCTNIVLSDMVHGMALYLPVPPVLGTPYGGPGLLSRMHHLLGANCNVKISMQTHTRDTNLWGMVKVPITGTLPDYNPNDPKHPLVLVSSSHNLTYLSLTDVSVAGLLAGLSSSSTVKSH